MKINLEKSNEKQQLGVDSCSNFKSNHYLIAIELNPVDLILVPAHCGLLVVFVKSETKLFLNDKFRLLICRFDTFYPSFSVLAKFGKRLRR